MKKLLFVLLILAVFGAPVVWGASESHEGDSVEAAEGSHDSADAAEGEHGGGHEEKSYFGIPGGVLKFINLVVFVGLLTFLLKKPIQGAFASRKETIQKKLAEAEERRKKADSLAEDIQKRLSQIEGEVDAILARARDEGERQKSEIIAAAEREKEKILATAKSQMDQRISQAKRELTDYAGKLAADKAQRMIEASLNDEDRERFFSESVEKIGEVSS